MQAISPGGYYATLWRSPAPSEVMNLLRTSMLALLLSGCAFYCYSGVPEVQNPDLDELSGLALSHADPKILWAHNDSGDGPYLFRVGLQGEDLGKLTVPGASNVDWEDIAAFDWQGRPALLVGDVGDNRGRREHVTLYAVSDPGPGQALQLLWQLDVRYPDGPRDCEALAVDQAGGAIILVSKREPRPHIYRVPLPQQAPGPGTAVVASKLGEIGNIPPPTLADVIEDPVYGHDRAWVTALDIARSGRFAVLVTYKDAYLYRHAPGQDWGEAFQAAPLVIDLPQLRQTEAGAIGADERELYVSSETRPAPLLRVPLPP